MEAIYVVVVVVVLSTSCCSDGNGVRDGSSCVAGVVVKLAALSN